MDKPTAHITYLVLARAFGVINDPETFSAETLLHIIAKLAAAMFSHNLAALFPPTKSSLPLSHADQ